MGAIASLVLTSMVLATSTGPCGEADLQCLRKSLLDTAENLTLTARELAFQRRLSQNLETQNAQLEASVAALSGAAKALVHEAPGHISWYQSPILWTAVGLTLGILLTVVAGLVVGQVAAGLAHQAR